jgi:hypothetical protein
MILNVPGLLAEMHLDHGRTVVAGAAGDRAETGPTGRVTCDRQRLKRCLPPSWPTHEERPAR